MYQMLSLMDPIPPTKTIFLESLSFVMCISWTLSSDLTLLYFSGFLMCISWNLSAVFLCLCRWLAWLLKPVAAAGGSAAQRQFGGKTLPGGNTASTCFQLPSSSISLIWSIYFSDLILGFLWENFARRQAGSTLPQPVFSFHLPVFLSFSQYISQV